MSTYSYNVFCPRCGNPAYVEGHSRLPEESLSCHFCGYSAGSKVDREKLVEGQPPEPEKFEHRPAGAYLIQHRSGGGEWGGVEAKNNLPLDWKKVINRFQEMLRNPDVDSSESYLTKWDDENKKLINLIGRPKILAFDDCPHDCPENCYEKFGERDREEWPDVCPKGFTLK
jgi:ribosomal protein S27AE